MLFHRASSSTAESGEKLPIHLDQVIERRLLGLSEKAHDDRVSLRRREATQVGDVVAIAEPGQLLDHLGADVGQVHLVDAHRPQPVASIEVGLHRLFRRGVLTGGRGLLWCGDRGRACGEGHGEETRFGHPGTMPPATAAIQLNRWGVFHRTLRCFGTRRAAGPPCAERPSIQRSLACGRGELALPGRWLASARSICAMSSPCVRARSPMSSSA